VKEKALYYVIRRNEVLKLNNMSNGYSILEVPHKFAYSYYFSLFNKSPSSIVCPTFWELKWSIGCPFSCDYCYLQGTFYGKKNFRLKDLSKLKEKLNGLLMWAEEKNVRLLFNAGELCDSLAVPTATEKLVRILKDVLVKYPHHRVLMVSKAGLEHTKKFLMNIKNFEDFFIVSYSINAEEVARIFEKAPSIKDRIKGAKEAKEYGLGVRFRIDPMIPIENWERCYTKLIDDILSLDTDPQRITIGTLRGLQKTLRYSKNKEWIAYLKNGEKTGWGLKLKFEVRKMMYTLVLEKLKEYGYKGDVSLCKETYEIWQELVKSNLLYHPGKCSIWENVKCNCRL
jgi:spore photoproduct lyase